MGLQILDPRFKSGWRLQKETPASRLVFLFADTDGEDRKPSGKAHPRSGTPCARREHSQRAGPPDQLVRGAGSLRMLATRTGSARAGMGFPARFSIFAIGVCKKKHQPTGWCFFLEAPPGFEPGVKDLQSHALPLGYGAKKMERATRFELATSTLARWRSAK